MALLGDRANRVMMSRFYWLRMLIRFDLWLYTRFLGPVRSTGDLLSYLFFEPELADVAIQVGQQDAQPTLAKSPNGHQTITLCPTPDIWR
jgi:hypothetical protein